MDLKQYIHEVISQIAAATNEINGGESDTRLIINPTLKEMRNIEGTKYAIYKEPGSFSLDCATQLIDVEFDVAITSENNSEAGGKLGISVFGLGAYSGENNTVANHVKFTLPVLFPSLKLDNKPLKG
ncbi:MAG: hypothetical protein ACI30S_05300 [Muribaculaceae bacterium]